MPMPLPSAAPVSAPFWPVVMFSQPPRTPAAKSSTRILFFNIPLSRHIAFSQRHLRTVSRKTIDFYRILVPLDLADNRLGQLDAQRLAIADGSDGRTARQHHDFLIRDHELLAELLEALR